MKRYAPILALTVCACNPNLTYLDADFHPTQRNWHLVWSDEFNGSSSDPLPDHNLWQVGQFCGGNNFEQQCYTASPQNVAVANGVLTITAMPELCSGSTVGNAEPNNWVGQTPTTCGSGSYKFSSAFIHTRVQLNVKHAWARGRIEIRAKLPYGTGTWPAFWLMPLNGQAYAYWPGAGEIDMMETANLRTPGEPKDWIQTNIHACSSVAPFETTNNSAAINGCKAYSSLTTNPGEPGSANDTDPDKFKKINSEKKWYRCRNDLVEQFHTYAIEWSDWDLRFYLDDELIQQFNHYPRNSQPFQEPFYLIINLAVGGRMTGYSTQSVPNPPADWLGSPLQPKAKLVLDWVRVYECIGDTTARSCIYQGQGLGPKIKYAGPDRCPTRSERRRADRPSVKGPEGATLAQQRVSPNHHLGPRPL